MNEPNKDTTSNADWADPVFDSFLEEAVTGVRPPDLRARIATAWQQELAGRIPLPTRANATGELIAPPVVNQKPISKSTVQRPSAEQTPARRSHAWQVLLVIAASGLLIACAVQWRSAFFAPKNDSIAKVPENQSKDLRSQELARDNAVVTSQPSPPKAARDSETLTLDNVPFSNPSTTESRPTRSELAEREALKLNDTQIVELIDTQLAQLWQRLNVTPAAKMDDLRLAQTLSQTLTGQELPAAAATELAELKPAERRERVISLAMDSQAFARRLSHELVSKWLQGGSLPADSEPFQKLEEFVASGISDAKPWDQLVSQVLAGDSAAGDVFVSAMAGGGNHRMASKLSGSFMDASLACVRCHEAKTPMKDIAAQQQYWSLVAMLMGLDATNPDKSNSDKSKVRVAVDKQAELFAAEKQPNLFFDRPDGTLEAAKFVLPDGQPWQSVEGAKTPRAALARWVSRSSQADAAIVNQVWQAALGRPLVAAGGLVDDAGSVERSELQQLLAQQFRAHGRNLTQLVSWIVRSEAFARDAIGVDRNRWLQATEEEIDKWHLAEMTFAARTSLGEQAVKGGLENSLAALVKWNQAGDSAANSNGSTVLAQPSLDPKLRLKNSVKSDVSMPAVGYVIHRGRLSADQQAYIDRLVASDKLSWDQKVEHIVGLVPGQTMSSGVKRMSEELLKLLNNPSEVLTELMWAVQNAEAS